MKFFWIILIAFLIYAVPLFSQQWVQTASTPECSNDKPNFVKSLVKTSELLKLGNPSLLENVYSPMKLGEYTSKSNDVKSLIESANSNIIFIPNKGQIIDTDGNLRPDIFYKASLNGLDLYLTNKGMSFVFYEYIDSPENLAAGKREMYDDSHPFRDDPVKDKEVKIYRMDLDIVGMNPNVSLLNEEQTEEYFNYYYAHCPDGITNVHGYRKVVFENVYDGIDLVYHSTPGAGRYTKGLKYDFIVKPGGDVSDIKLKYKPAWQSDMNEDAVFLTEEGKIRALTPLGEIETDVLYTYQSDGKLVESNYIKEPDGTIRINTAEYDKTKELIIDPYIGATYYGGNQKEDGNSITTDGNNNILITGRTGSNNFPVQNPGGGAFYQGTFGGGLNPDAFILKFHFIGARSWATYYGGNYWDEGTSIATDGNNNILITGNTSSSNFPVHNPGGGAYFQGTNAGGDVFILKFNSSGARQWATYYGGTALDHGRSITTDGYNNILITGETWSPNFPVHNPGGGAYFQGTNAGNYDVFILKFNLSGVRNWATYYGGISNDIGRSITTDGNNNILITGSTRSSDFPVQNPGGAYYQGSQVSGYDAFILKFNSSGVRNWATYYGGNGDDEGTSIAIDEYNYILITGYTLSSDFPVRTPGGGAYFQATHGGGSYEDIFILKFNQNGARYWATYYGGNNQDKGYEIATDGSDNILVTGRTGSTNFPVQNPGAGAYFQGTKSGNSDVFILKFNSSGVRFWSTYYGGNDWDFGTSITSDIGQNIMVTGNTESTNFPLQNPGGFSYYQGTYGGNGDAFIIGFTPEGAIINIHKLNTSVPDNYALHQNYPNPFNPITKIRFELPSAGVTTLKIFNILGKEVATLFNNKLSPGSYEYEWNAGNLPSGVYFYKLIANDFTDVKKMLLLK